MAIAGHRSDKCAGCQVRFIDTTPKRQRKADSIRFRQRRYSVDRINACKRGAESR